MMQELSNYYHTFGRPRFGKRNVKEAGSHLSLRPIWMDRLWQRKTKLDWDGQEVVVTDLHKDRTPDMVHGSA
ncbi:hypothetical protein SprV_0501873100 [Sparganum proliferum]